MPQLLRGMLEEAVQTHDDCMLLKHSGRVFAALTERMAPPDIVVLGVTAAEDATLVPALFAQWPRAQVMTVMQTGDETAAYELRPRRTALGQMSPAEMVETLRELVYRSRELSQEA
jgi:DNA-binding NarL/FixJ family response regulator